MKSSCNGFLLVRILLHLIHCVPQEECSTQVIVTGKKWQLLREGKRVRNEACGSGVADVSKLTLFVGEKTSS